jgi:hypothetical protein
MKKIRKLWIAPVALFVSGCDSMVQMNAQSNAARVQVAALQSQATVGAEWARTQAAASVAQAQAMSEVAQTVAWSSQLPWVVTACCLTVIVVAYIWYRSRVAYPPPTQPYPPAQILPPPPRAKVLPTPAERQAALQFAHSHGGQVVWTPEGTPHLQVDGRRIPLRITAK